MAPMTVDRFFESNGRLDSRLDPDLASRGNDDPMEHFAGQRIRFSEVPDMLDERETIASLRTTPTSGRHK